MAKKDDANITGRVLQKVIPAGQVTLSGGTAALAGAIKNWEVGTAGTYTLVASRERIDLSGYSLQDKTVFFQGVMNQEIGTVQGFNAGGGVIQVLNLVTTTPVSLADLSSLQSDGFGWLIPGSSQSTFDLDNVIQGRLRQYEQLSTTSFISQTAMSTYGSGDSTAAENLYLTTAMIYPTNVDGTVFLPDQAYVIPVMIAEEPELEYMMRLARSLEPVY
jgi:hypothetical protein